MNRKYQFLFGLVAFVLLAVSAFAIVTTTKAATSSTLVDTVRAATAKYQDVKAAEADGYQLFAGCVSGPNGGAMGIHYVNPKLVDGDLDAQHPEALLYEDQNGTMRLTGVEFVAIAEAWNAKHQTPPVVMGQLFNYNPGPNRFALPNFYAMHVWAWKDNPDGMFADWNPQVSCNDFAGSN